jgi:hypothetical protein
MLKRTDGFFSQLSSLYCQLESTYARERKTDGYGDRDTEEQTYRLRCITKECKTNKDTEGLRNG